MCPDCCGCGNIPGTLVSAANLEQNKNFSGAEHRVFWLKAIAVVIGATLLQLLVWVALFVAVTAFGIAWLCIKDRFWPPAVLDARKLAALRRELRQLQTYCWRIEKAGGRRRSHLGGLPYMSADRAWPRVAGKPLPFIAQVNLADLRAKEGPDWLPAQGHLLFFADVRAGAWVVMHEHDLKAVRKAEAPQDLPKVSRRQASFMEKPVYFRRARSWPSWERLKTKATLDEDEAARESLRIAPDPEPAHQVGGFPCCVQGDWMEWELELAVRGIRPENFAAWLETPGAALIEPDVRQWRLLLQIDSDSDTGFHWEDAGTLYFWIREADARAGNFAATRMVAQFC